MLKVMGCISDQHDIRLVALAAVLCALACYTAITMLWRAASHDSTIRAFWSVGAAVVFGCGVWTTHFVAMLAYDSTLVMGYEVWGTAGSFVAICIGAWAAFWLLLRGLRPPFTRLLAGMLLGYTVGLMHFTGALAMRFHGTVEFDRGTVITAFAAGMTLAGAALVVADDFRMLGRRLTAAALLVLSIIVLHFTGMAAITLVRGPDQPASGLMIGTSVLGIGVAAIASLLALISLFSAFVDQYLERRVAREERTLRHMTHHDILTGLPNRLMLREALGRTLQEVESRAAGCAVLCLDLDRFKIVNDLYGHQTGDDVLVQVARMLRSLARPADLVARTSGDEFAIAMPAASMTDAVALADRLVSATAEPFAVGGQQIGIGTSVGIALYPADGATPVELLQNADIALYQAKNDGRGMYRFFEASMSERLRHRQSLEYDLRRGILNHEFELHYQPILDMRTQGITGYEALVRWNHPQRGVVPPTAFIPLAEESGLIVSLGRWVLERACTDAAGWDRPLRVAVNLSPVQFREARVAEMLADILAQTGLAPHRLELEVTENVLVRHAEEALEILNAVRRLGVSLSLDDFGTGYSSLSYLRRYPFNKIKIDRSFIQSLGTDRESDVIAAAIITLGHSLQLKVTAEGVETDGQLAFLYEKGCDHAQGYLIGRPVPSLSVNQPTRARIEADLIAGF